MTRGQRNNNPANIRHSSSMWKGMTKRQTDKEFVQFIDKWWGLRALFVLLRTYYHAYNCCSVWSVIKRFAPPCENDTEKYVKFVEHYMGDNEEVCRNANMWVDDKPLIRVHQLVKAICWIESQMIIDDDDIELALGIL